MALWASIHVYESVEDKTIPVASAIYFYKHTCNAYVYMSCDRNKQDVVCDGWRFTRRLSVRRAH
jgi:hypothetical protein